MRLLPIATTAFLTASSSPSSAFAFSRSAHYQLSKPSSLFFLSALITHPRNKSTIVAAAAAENDSAASECNATTNNDNTPPLLSEMYDAQYPGTAVQRLRAVHERVSTLANDGTLNGTWEDARRRLLWAGGLKDLPDSIPGRGYTGHSFNDFNHVF